MADPVTEICDKTGVDRGAALYYLEGFNWDLNSAMEACLTKTLPPLTGEDSSPEVSINVKSALDSPSTPPRTADSVRISNLPEKQQQSPPQSRNELIRAFVGAIDGTNSDDAVAYLTRFNWNADLAADAFLAERRPTPSERKNFLSTVPIDGSSSSSSSSMKFDLNAIIKDADEALMVTSLANVGSISQGTSAPMMVDSRGGSNQLLNSPMEQPSQEKDKLIDSLLGFAHGTTREEAIACLELCNWNVDDAAIYFLDQGPMEMDVEQRGLPSQSQFQASLGYSKEGASGSSSSSTNTGIPFDDSGLVDVPVAVSGNATSQVVENRNSEAVDEDPSTETGPEPLATQDTNIVEPRAEPITTEITFKVFLADDRYGGEVDMTFKSDQTVRDIRNKIQEYRPDDNRNYFLRSLEDEDAIFNDLNTTVQMIYARGATKLIQVLSD